MHAARRPSPLVRLVLAVVACGSTASAAAPSHDDALTAQALFDLGVALKQRGQYVEACAKLEESQRVDPGVGTQYHLADCYEKQGRTAAALQQFEEIARQAAVSGQKDRERVARQRAAEVAPSVPRLTVAVPVKSDAATLEITCDAQPFPRDRWNTPMPLDPGMHEVTARLGDRAWRANVTLDARSHVETITVPDLAPPELAAPATPTAWRVSLASQRHDSAPAPMAARSSSGRVVGLALGAAGLAAIGSGVFFTFRSLDDRATAESLGCAGSSCPTQAGVDARSSAVAAGNVATVAYAVGAVATGVGVYLLVRHEDGRPAPRVAATLGPLGAQLGGAF
jgi:serine/threonine-protein kinase